MGKLIDNLQWSLAYSLLKTLDIYEALRDSMFWWAAAEIYLSVGRYLKTFEILKSEYSLFPSIRRDKVNIAQLELSVCQSDCLSNHHESYSCNRKKSDQLITINLNFENDGRKV